MLHSNPTVSSRIYREATLTSTRSGLRESPVMMLGDRNEGRSVYNKHVDTYEKSVCKIEKRKIVTPGVSTIFQVGCTARDDMLKSFSFEAEGACR